MQIGRNFDIKRSDFGSNGWRAGDLLRFSVPPFGHVPPAVLQRRQVTLSPLPHRAAEQIILSENLYSEASPPIFSFPHRLMTNNAIKGSISQDLYCTR